MQLTTSASGQKWEGRWDQLAGKAKKIWGNITDDDLLRAKGDYQQTVGVIKEKSGQTLEDIEKALDA